MGGVPLFLHFFFGGVDVLRSFVLCFFESSASLSWR